jgi:hypothetical protein
MDRGMANTTTEQPVSGLSNDAVIIRLLYTVNHLSRWLSPIHDDVKLTRSPQRDEPSVKDIVIRIRDNELRVFPQLHAIATQDRPDLDALPPLVRTDADIAFDRQANFAGFGSRPVPCCGRCPTAPGSAMASAGPSMTRRSGCWRSDWCSRIRFTLANSIGP